MFNYAIRTIVLCALTLSVTTAFGAATVVVGDHILLPNTPHQPIPIFVSGASTQSKGIDLNAQIGDGGVLLGGTTIGPGFDGTKQEVLLGPPNTIWTNNNTGVNDVNAGAFGNLVMWLSTTTASGFAHLNGQIDLIGTLYVSTVGFGATNFDQVWPLVLSAGDGNEFPFNTNGPTDMLSPQGDILSPDLGGFIVDGHIIIKAVPEPSTMVLAVLAAIACIAATQRERICSSRKS